MSNQALIAEARAEIAGVHEKGTRGLLIKRLADALEASEAKLEAEIRKSSGVTRKCQELETENQNMTRSLAEHYALQAAADGMAAELEQFALTTTLHVIKDGKMVVKSGPILPKSPSSPISKPGGSDEHHQRRVDRQ